MFGDEHDKENVMMEKIQYEKPEVVVIEVESPKLLQASRDSYGPVHEG